MRGVAMNASQYANLHHDRALGASWVSQLAMPTGPMASTTTEPQRDRFAVPGLQTQSGLRGVMTPEAGRAVQSDGFQVAMMPSCPH